MKKTYMKPATKAVAINTECALMAGSMTTIVSEKTVQEAADEGGFTQLAKEHEFSVWDD